MKSLAVCNEKEALVFKYTILICIFIDTLNNTSKILYNMYQIISFDIFFRYFSVGNNSKKEVSDVINYQNNLETIDILPATEENLT